MVLYWQKISQSIEFISLEFTKFGKIHKVESKNYQKKIHWKGIKLFIFDALAEVKII